MCSILWHSQDTQYGLSVERSPRTGAVSSFCCFTGQRMWPRQPHSWQSFVLFCFCWKDQAPLAQGGNTKNSAISWETETSLRTSGQKNWLSTFPSFQLICLVQGNSEPPCYKSWQSYLYCDLEFIRRLTSFALVNPDFTHPAHLA